MTMALRLRLLCNSFALRLLFPVRVAQVLRTRANVQIARSFHLSIPCAKKVEEARKGKRNPFLRQEETEEEEDKEEELLQSQDIYNEDNVDEDEDEDENAENQDDQELDPTKPAKENFQRILVTDGYEHDEVNLISETGKNMGLMATASALKIAAARGLQLWEVNRKTDPPFCRLFERSIAKTLESYPSELEGTGKIKEVRFNTQIAKNDLKTKVNQIENFLKKGYTTKVVMMPKTRFFDISKLIVELNKFLAQFSSISFVAIQPRQFGRNITSVLSPSKSILDSLKQSKLEAKKKKLAEKKLRLDSQQKNKSPQKKNDAAQPTHTTPPASDWSPLGIFGHSAATTASGQLKPSISKSSSDDDSASPKPTPTNQRNQRPGNPINTTEVVRPKKEVVERESMSASLSRLFQPLPRDSSSNSTKK